MPGIRFKLVQLRCYPFADKDGYIDASDLLLGLKYVNIKCPMSRCQYRQKEDAILDFFGKIDYKGNM